MFPLASNTVRRAWVDETARQLGARWPASSRRRRRQHAVIALVRPRVTRTPAPVRS